MEHKIVFATSNAGKMREIREILKDLGAEILSMKEAGVDVDIVEDGDTFAANALIKAKAVWEKTGGIVLADDSGLVIDALNGEPGVYSARYMGEKTSYEIKNWNLIHRLDGVPEEKRTARFVCVIAAVLPDGRTLTAEGTMEGVIAHEPAGAGGFGGHRGGGPHRRAAVRQPAGPAGQRGPAAGLYPVPDSVPPDRGAGRACGASSDPGAEYR